MVSFAPVRAVTPCIMEEIDEFASSVFAVLYALAICAAAAAPAPLKEFAPEAADATPATALPKAPNSTLLLYVAPSPNWSEPGIGNTIVVACLPLHENLINGRDASVDRLLGKPYVLDI